VLLCVPLCHSKVAKSKSAKEAFIVGIKPQDVSRLDVTVYYASTMQILDAKKNVARTPTNVLNVQRVLVNGVATVSLGKRHNEEDVVVL
jgi:hypothetical protein